MAKTQAVVFFCFLLGLAVYPAQAQPEIPLLTAQAEETAKPSQEEEEEQDESDVVNAPIKPPKHRPVSGFVLSGRDKNNGNFTRKTT